MGVTNFDNLPQNTAATRLKEARQVMRERKGSPQRVAGSNLRYFRTDNDGEFAWSGQLDTVSIQSSEDGVAFFTITLLSATAPVFLSDLVLELFDSVDGTTWTEHVPGTGPFGYRGYALEHADAAAAENFKAKYRLSIFGDLDAYRAFKLQALTTDEVGISVERNA